MAGTVLNLLACYLNYERFNFLAKLHHSPETDGE